MPTFVVPSATYSVGVTALGPFVVTTGFTTLLIHLNRVSLVTGSNGVEVLRLETEISLDSGVTWRPWCGLGIEDGVVINPKTALPYTESTIKCPIPSPCQLRGTVTAARALTFAVSFEVT